MKASFTFPTFFLLVFITVACGVVCKFPAQSFRQEEKPVTLAEFNKRVANKDKSVLVYFHADWCFVCRKTDPVISEVEKELQGKVDVLRIDTERDQEITDAFEVDALPLFVLYKNGQKQWIRFGVMDKNELMAKIGTQ